MKKLVCTFSGWFEIPADEVLLVDPNTQRKQTAEQWHNEGNNLVRLVFDDFGKTLNDSSEGLFSQCEIEIEEQE